MKTLRSKLMKVVLLGIMLIGMIITNIPSLYAGGGFGGGLRELLDESSEFSSNESGMTVRGGALFIQTVTGKDDMICIPVPKPKPKPEPEPKPNNE
jgi:hypothetical protein